MASKITNPSEVKRRLTSLQREAVFMLRVCWVGVAYCMIFAIVGLVNGSSAQLPEIGISLFAATFLTWFAVRWKVLLELSRKTVTAKEGILEVIGSSGVVEKRLMPEEVSLTDVFFGGSSKGLSKQVILITRDGRGIGASLSLDAPARALIGLALEEER